MAPVTGPATFGAMWMLPLALAADGTVTLEPDVVPVDEKVTLTLTFTVGDETLSVGHGIVTYEPLFHGMRWSRWGYLVSDPAMCTPYAPPSTSDDDPPSVGVVTVSTDGDADLILSRSVESPSLHTIGRTTILVAGGELVEGDTVTITIGDTAEGEDCGLQSSIRRFDHVPWPLYVRAPSGKETLIGAPTFSFRAEGEPVTLLVSAPSQAVTGEDYTVRVAVMDDHGNALQDYTEPVQLGGQSVVPTEGVAVFTLQGEKGVQRLVAESGKLSGVSNPVVVDDSLPDRQVFWGDLHTHHGHSYREDDGFLRDMNHDYARDVVGLHVGCESLKATPLELEAELVWTELQESCEDYTVDGEYVAMLGFEWMGNEVSPGEEGHHNVYYDGCDGPLGYAALVGLQDEGGNEGLWSYMDRAFAEHGVRSVSIPHATLYTGFNWRDRDDERRPLAEVYSEWGGSATDETLNDLQSGTYVGLAEGHRMGLIGASDNHDGWLGNRWGYKNDYAGLGAYVAPELTRAHVFEAMQTRSTYATTGHRPVLRFGATDGAEIPMGSIYVAEQPSFGWRYHGETSVELVELLGVSTGGDVEVLETWKPAAEDTEGHFEHAWDGSDQAVWLHVVEVDGEEAWSSPIWLTDCDDDDAWDAAERCGGDTGPVDSGDTAQDTDPGGDGGDGGDGGNDTGDGGEGRCGNCASGSAGLWVLALAVLGIRRR